MLRWILGITLKDNKRNDNICWIIAVACVTDKLREARLRWYGHMQRRKDDGCAKRIPETEQFSNGPIFSSLHTWLILLVNKYRKRSG